MLYERHAEPHPSERPNSAYYLRGQQQAHLRTSLAGCGGPSGVLVIELRGLNPQRFIIAHNNDECAPEFTAELFVQRPAHCLAHCGDYTTAPPIADCTSAVANATSAADEAVADGRAAAAGVARIGTNATSRSGA